MVRSSSCSLFGRFLIKTFLVRLDSLSNVTSPLQAFCFQELSNIRLVKKHFQIFIFSSFIFAILKSNRIFFSKKSSFYLFFLCCGPCFTCIHNYWRRKKLYCFSFVPLDLSLELRILFMAKYAVFALFILNWISLSILFFCVYVDSKVFKFIHSFKGVRTHF